MRKFQENKTRAITSVPPKCESVLGMHLTGAVNRSICTSD